MNMWLLVIVLSFFMLRIVLKIAFRRHYVLMFARISKLIMAVRENVMLGRVFNVFGCVCECLFVIVHTWFGVFVLMCTMISLQNMFAVLVFSCSKNVCII